MSVLKLENSIPSTSATPKPFRPTSLFDEIDENTMIDVLDQVQQQRDHPPVVLQPQHQPTLARTSSVLMSSCAPRNATPDIANTTAISVGNPSVLSAAPYVAFAPFLHHMVSQAPNAAVAQVDMQADKLMLQVTESDSSDDDDELLMSAAEGQGDEDGIELQQLDDVAAQQELLNLTQAGRKEINFEPPLQIDLPPLYDEQPVDDMLKNAPWDFDSEEEIDVEVPPMEKSEDWPSEHQRMLPQSNVASKILGEAATADIPSRCVAAAATTSRPALSSTPAWFDGDASYSQILVAHYVPSYLAAAYASEMRIHQLYPWQAECLQQGDQHAMKSGNLVYSAPTSGGKTLVAELLIFRYILRYNLFRSRDPSLNSATLGFPSTFRSLFVVPFNSLVQEKARDLQMIVHSMYNHLQQTPSSSFGADIQPDEDAPRIHVKAIELVTDLAEDSHIVIGVVTIEKAAMIIQQMITEKRTAEIGCVVIDVSVKSS